MERFIAGLLTAFSLCVTAIAVAFLFSVYRGGLEITQSVALWSAVPTLLLFLGVVGFSLGALLGSERTVILLSHLWGTARPPQPLFSTLLWLCVAVLWFVAYRVVLHGLT